MPSPAPGFAAVLLTNANEPSQQTFTSPDGRTRSYGAPTGPIVFHLDGLGDSPLTAVHLDITAKTLGVRISAVDEPGIGYSSPQLNRTALDHAEDIRLLAAPPGVRRYSVVGESDGGLYALACARALPKEEFVECFRFCCGGCARARSRG
jgi:pimeloyl-ACP methyl ester carboxylesterase